MKSLVFFFQAEDGIRDYKVTGVQTCALPILDCLLIKSFARADLRGVDLSGRDLRYVDLRGADLRGANLAGAQLPSDLSGTIVSGESTRDLSQFLTRKELWGKIGDEFGLMAFLALTTQQQEI